MRTSLVFDSQPISRRTKTADGLLVPAMIAAWDNVQSYFAAELGLKDLPATQQVRVYRPRAAVQDAAPTFVGKPITLEHPRQMVSPKTWRAVARGEAKDVHPGESGLEADLLVRDEALISAIERKEKTEVSCAYDFELTMAPGTSPHGQAYDAVASNIQGNHIAIVGKGRSRTPSGQPCQVADSKQGDRKMRVLVFDAALLGTATATQLPEMDDAVAAQVDGLVRSLAAARDSAVQERDAVIEEAAGKLEAQATDHAEKLKALEDELPARIEAAAQDRASVLAGAAKLGLELKAEGKDTATLRREVLTEAIKDPARKAVMDAMVPDIAKASPEALSLATAALFALPAVAKDKKAQGKDHALLGAALVGKKDKATASDAGDKEAPCGRDAAIVASANAWRGNKDKK